MSGDASRQEGRGYAPESEGDPSAASTLVRLAERLATALDVWECCIYEYVEAGDCLRAQAIWSRDLQDRDIAWVGAESRLNHRPDVARVFSEHATVVTHADAPELATEATDRMDYWGEKSALFAPIGLDDELLGVLELTEHRAHRDFGEEDVRLISALADVAAVAIANARGVRREEAVNARLSALLDAGRAITSTMVLEEVLQRLAERAAEALHVPSCYIYEYDAIGDAIIWRSEWQANAERRDPDSPGTAYPLSDYPWDRAALHSGEMVLASVDDPGLHPAQLASMREWGELTMLTVPLRFGAETVGMMELAQTQPGRRFDPADMELARALGEQAAAAIRNAQLYRREAWRNERLVKVLDLSRTVSSSLDADAVVEAVRSRIGGLFPDRHVKVAAIRLPEQESSGSPPAAPEGDGLVRRVLHELRPEQSREGDDRRLVVPLVVQARAEGWVEIRGAGARGFAEDEIELVQILANQAAAALDNTRLYETLARQAITDGLTGLYNHRFFYERLRAEVARARRYDLQLSLLMMDLDDFKTYNDRFGHPAGDGVLRRVAQIMTGQLRNRVDIPARYGGEEFAVILPHTETPGAETVGTRLSHQVGAIEEDLAAPHGALVAGERVRHSVEATAFPGRASRDVVHITISVGVASLPAHALDAEQLVHAADTALYLAKQHGKNRVEVFT